MADKREMTDDEILQAKKEADEESVKRLTEIMMQAAGMDGKEYDDGEDEFQKVPKDFRQEWYRETNRQEWYWETIGQEWTDE
jgi:hypothetical protein